MSSVAVNSALTKNTANEVNPLLTMQVVLSAESFPRSLFKSQVGVKELSIIALGKTSTGRIASGRELN